MVVNGGGTMTLRVEKEGYLPIDRRVTPNWQATSTLDDVRLTPLAPVIGSFSLDGESGLQVADGPLVSDERGERETMIVFPEGRQAWLEADDGTLTELDELTLRVTEYTTGEYGPEAMSGTLPESSAYTYAAEISADEAIAGGSAHVVFDAPVYFYVDNFLGFPAGSDVPTGVYNRAGTRWEAQQSGRVYDVISSDGVTAVLDNQAGIGAEELAVIAARYATGDSFWRVPIRHFSSFDCNFPSGPSGPGGGGPGGGSGGGNGGGFGGGESLGPPEPDDGGGCNDEESGSFISARSQVLGEKVDVVGAPFYLNYSSAGRAKARTSFSVIISDDGSFRPELKRIDLEISVAGRTFRETFPAEPNQTYDFEWDALDDSGRRVVGSRVATVEVDYVYDSFYMAARTFGENSGEYWEPRISAGERHVPTRWEEIVVGPVPAGHLGGWTPSVHHSYDPLARTLKLGSGGSLSARAVIQRCSSEASGAGAIFQDWDVNFTDMVADEAGGAYVALERKIAYVDANCVTSIVVENEQDDDPSTPPEYCQPGNARIYSNNVFDWSDYDRSDAHVCQIFDLALAPDGSLYFVDAEWSIKKLSTDGVVSVVDRTTDDCGWPVPVSWNPVREVAVGPEGEVYFTCQATPEVHWLPPGANTTVVFAGQSKWPNSTYPSQVDVPGQQAEFEWAPSRLEVGARGEVSWVEKNHNRAYRVGGDGIVRRGTGAYASDRTADINGNVHALEYGDVYDGFLRVTPGGNAPRVDGARAGAVAMWEAADIAVTPAGATLMMFPGDGVWRLAPGYPGFSNEDLLVPSRDGSEVYHFDPSGTHLETLDARTGARIWSFTYDSAGLLSAIVDRAGDQYRFERDPDGNPTALVTPSGIRTTFAVDENGYLAGVTNPAFETIELTSNLGLLVEFRNALGYASVFTYDDAGRLIKDTDAVGGYKAFERTTDAGGSGFVVSMTTAEGATKSWSIDANSDESEQVDTDFNGLSVEAVKTSDGVLTVSRPDGMETALEWAPDPRWGMAAPYLSSERTTTPAGLEKVETRSRTVELTDARNPLSLASQTDTITTNAVTMVREYDAGTRTTTRTSPMGRVSTATFDSQGLMESSQAHGMALMSVARDSQGRATSVTVGDRTMTFAQDPNGYPANASNALGETTSWTHDGAGRVVSATTHEGDTTSFAYDAAGNVVGVTPPGQPEHTLAYTPVDLLESYTTPSPDGTAPAALYQYEYDLDRRVTGITQPGGSTVAVGYDSSSQVDSMIHPGGTLTFGYDATSGRLTTADTGAVALQYTYDGRLLLDTFWTGAVTGKVSREYDDFFRVAAEKVNDSYVATYTYDPDGAVTAAGSMSLSYETTTGLLDTRTVGSVVDDLSYNQYGEVTGYDATIDGSPIYGVSYGRDDLGRIVTRTETIEGVTTDHEYAYDGDGTLVSVAENGDIARDYTYDTNGNRLDVLDSLTGQTVDGTYDDQDRIISYGDTSFTFDDNGRLERKTSSEGTTDYGYDAFGNLIWVGLANGSVVEYDIDANGRRVAKSVNGVRVAGFLWADDLRIVAELDGANNVVSRFVYTDGAGLEGDPVSRQLRRLGLGVMAAYGRSTTPAYVVRGSRVLRILADHLGSPRLLVDTVTGEVVGRRDYDEWGEVMNDTLSAWLPQGFAGGLFDADTGLTRFGARDYCAETGRWLAQDPIRFDGKQSNLYAYVGGDPVNRVDPTGEEQTDPLTCKEIKQFRIECETEWIGECENEGVRDIVVERCKKLKVIEGQCPGWCRGKCGLNIFCLFECTGVLDND